MTLAVLHTSVIAQTFDPTWAARFQTILDSTLEAEKIKGASIAVYAPGMGMLKVVMIMRELNRS